MADLGPTITDKWNELHAKLTAGDELKGMPPNCLPQLRAIFFTGAMAALDPRLDRMSGMGECMAAVAPDAPETRMLLLALEVRKQHGG